MIFTLHISHVFLVMALVFASAGCHSIARGHDDRFGVGLWMHSAWVAAVLIMALVCAVAVALHLPGGPG